MQAGAGLCLTWGWPGYAAPTSSSFDALPKALWVWLKSLDELEGLARFAKLHRFGALMIHFRKDARAALLDASPAHIQVLRDLRERGCACIALAGEPQWAARDALPNTVAQLLAIERRHALFDGLHYDVEPHSLPRWREPDGKADLLGGLARLAQRTREALPASMALQLALNPKHALTPMPGEAFLPRIAPYVQEVALMAYRDTPQRQVEAARLVIRELDALDVYWRMGVLSNPPKEPGVSYHGTPPDAFAQTMNELWRQIRAMPRCRGLIFENYHSLRLLLGAENV